MLRGPRTARSPDDLPSGTFEGHVGLSFPEQVVVVPDGWSLFYASPSRLIAGYGREFYHAPKGNRHEECGATLVAAATYPCCTRILFCSPMNSSTLDYIY